MASVIPANQVTIADLESRYGLHEAAEFNFFSEWQEELPELTALEKQYLDRVKNHFTRLLNSPPLLENSVKMVVLSPLLDLAGFYDEPFHIRSEVSVEVEAETETETEVIRGRIDVLVLKESLWVLALEAKRSDFDVTVATGQALAYLLSRPETNQAAFALITNGQNCLFLKLGAVPQPQYAHSRLFSLFNPGNDLYQVLQVMKNLGKVTVTNS